MIKLLHIAFRNLMRYRRRTIMTVALIAVGMFAVLLFAAVGGSFKQMMIGQITDSMLGHLQIHRKGYVSSIDNLPLNLTLNQKQIRKLRSLLNNEPSVVASSMRLKFGAMLSNFVENTNTRINGIEPADEFATCPLLPSRLKQQKDPGMPLARGQILIPDLIAKGMKVKTDDTIVLVTTNRDGSVNGMQFTVAGLVEGISGPGGRDGYIHLADARDLLRMTEPEISEIAIRLKQFDQVEAMRGRFEVALAADMDAKGKPVFEVHDWEKLTPFSNIADMIDLLSLFIRIMLVAIVLISILNVMIMAVYERLKEIGTMSAMGTRPRTITLLFLFEGLLLGCLGVFAGVVCSLAAVGILHHLKLSFDFGRQTGLQLEPVLSFSEVGISVLLVMLVAVIASVQPARKAARMKPVDCLRAV